MYSVLQSILTYLKSLFLISIFATSFQFKALSQCDSVVISSDLTVNSDDLMSGIYVVQGIFTITSNTTVYVTPYANNGCGELKIYAEQIIIDGKINGDFAGFEGGAGGSKGQTVTSNTGHIASLTACSDEGSQGHINVAGGLAGSIGNGPGAGVPGNLGTSGSGAKQYCGSFGDDAGLVGGGAGAGSASGASYGGIGAVGGIGGNGSNVGTANNASFEDSYAPVGGQGGNGGIASNPYGTQNGRDISKGSGGAGAGGGGRSFYLGSDGGKGGAGGGLVFLKANSDLNITGTISVKGKDGEIGGAGGNGDATADCCSDGCNGCDERTFSCGAGSGGGAGGGSGGGIFIESLGNANISGELIADGGLGGNSGLYGNGTTCDYSASGFCGANSFSTGNGTSGQAGGAGSGGRIKIFVLECSQYSNTGTISIQGGGVNADNGTLGEVCGYLAIEEIKEELDFMIYPNPFDSQFTLVLNIENDLDLILEITNSVGTLVHQSNQINQKSNIDLSNVDSGVYFVRIISENQNIIKKIIKK